MAEELSSPIKLVAVDLDGTLLRDDKTISKEDILSLEVLGKNGIVRVAATGRSMHKVREVIGEEVPFDYIVFSSGSGIYDWEQQILMKHEVFSEETAASLFCYLLTNNLNFFAFRPIPQNNLFTFHEGGAPCNEFNSYLERHRSDGNRLDINNCPKEAGQFMCILPNDELLFDNIRSQIMQSCNPIKIIRTTSPVNGHYIWMEIFPETVSKGHGLAWLCKKFDIGCMHTIALGNDFNDLDMLEFSGHPWVVANASYALKALYPTLPVNNNENSLKALCQKFGFIGS